MKKAVLGIIGIIFVAWFGVPAMAADTIVIGAVVPLSGGTAHYGTNCKRGLEMAFEEINAKGGITVQGKKYQMRLEACDDEGKSDKASTCGRKLSSQDNVPVIYTPASWSGFPMMGFNEKMNFIIMCTSQSATFTTQGNKLVVRWSNNPAVTHGPWVKLLLKQMQRSNLNVKRVGVMEVNTEVGKQWAAAFMREWEKNGGVIVGKESFDANQTDYYTQLTSLLGKKVDGIMLNVTDEPSSVVIKQARELGFQGVFIDSAACSGDKLMTLVKPEWTENVFLECTSYALGGPKIEAFIAKYKAKFKEDPVVSAFQGNDGGRTIAMGIEKAQSFDPAKIHAVLPSILPIPDCLDCARDMNPATGETYIPTYVKHIKGGKMNLIRE